MNPFFWQGPPNIFVCHIHATTTFYAVTSTNLASCSIHLILVSRIGMVWLDDFCPRVEILFVVVSLGGYISKGPKFLCKYWARGGWSKCSSLSCVTLSLLMDVLLHLEFLNPQVQITPTSSECPQPLVPQVGIGNQVLVQSESREGHSQMFASPPLHVLLPARIGPVPWGSLYLGTLWWEQEWQYFHQVPLVYPSSLQMFVAPCWLFHLQVATGISKSTVFLKRV